MLYAAFVFWFVVAIFAARAVYGLLQRVVPAKVLNYALLPGTLVAQIGHHVALLITGGTISQSRLANESTGEPELQTDAKPRIPVLGPALVAVVPIFLCGLALVFAADWLRAGSMIREVRKVLPQSLPRDLPGLWDRMRLVVDSLDDAAAMWSNANWDLWVPWLLAYLTICLTVRMSPLSEDLRPAMLGVAMFGVLAWLIGMFTPQLERNLLAFWPHFSFLIANLLLVLLLALAVSAGVSLFNLVKGPGGAGAPAGKPAGRAAKAA